MKTIETLANVLASGKVKRLHTRETLREQTLAAHQWRVATLVLYVTRDAQASVAALFHDSPELVTGDIPAPVKWGKPDLEHQLRQMENEFVVGNGLELYQSDLEIKDVVKTCDYLELALFCTEERAMGNTTMTGILDNALHAASSYMERVKRERWLERLTEIYQYVLRYSDYECKRTAGGRLSLQDGRGGTLGPRSAARAGLFPGTDHEVRGAVEEEERAGGSEEGAPLPGQVHRDRVGEDHALGAVVGPILRNGERDFDYYTYFAGAGTYGEGNVSRATERRSEEVAGVVGAASGSEELPRKPEYLLDARAARAIHISESIEAGYRYRKESGQLPFAYEKAPAERATQVDGEASDTRELAEARTAFEEQEEEVILTGEEASRMYVAQDPEDHRRFDAAD